MNDVPAGSGQVGTSVMGDAGIRRLKTQLTHVGRSKSLCTSTIAAARGRQKVVSALQVANASCERRP